jgi:hypothetical protein
MKISKSRLYDIIIEIIKQYSGIKALKWIELDKIAFKSEPRNVIIMTSAARFFRIK